MKTKNLSEKYCKSMLRKLCFAIVLLFINFVIILNSYSQSSPDTISGWESLLFDPNANFFEVQAKAEAFFEQNAALKTTQGSSWKVFKRWEWFWESRVDASGSYDTANLAMQDYLMNSSVYCGTSSVTSNWQFLGPFTLSTQHMGLVTSIYVDPSDNNIIYAGTNASGMWKTTDGGNNWTNLTDITGLGGMGVEEVVVDPSNSSTIYIATGLYAWGKGYGVGVLKSTDGGTSWNITGLSFNFNDDKHITKLIINPNDPDILFAATTDGIYRTLDAGSSWTLVLNQSYAFRGLEFEPGTPSTIIASGNDIFKSTDGGITWGSLTGPSTGLDYATDQFSFNEMSC